MLGGRAELAAMCFSLRLEPEEGGEFLTHLATTLLAGASWRTSFRAGCNSHPLLDVRQRDGRFASYLRSPHLRQFSSPILIRRSRG